VADCRTGRFIWHPATRVFDRDGVVGPVEPGCAVIEDRPVGRALALALAQGDGFRIGAPDQPQAAGAGMFETLTGGSLGSPRRVIRPVASWQASFAVNAGLFGIGPGVVVAVPGRLCHSLPLYAALEAAHLGAEVHLLDGLRPDRAAAAMRACAAEVVYATPTQMRQMVAAGRAWPAMRHVVLGGERLDSGLRQALCQAAPAAQITAFYGAAETSFVTMTDDQTPEGSVGAAYPGVRIDIRQGEIWVTSPYVAQGDGWVSVGEIGRLEAGYLYLQGRAGRMVTIAGQNVFPEEIEGWLTGLPGIDRVAVFAVPDARRGHVLQAIVQGDAGQQAAIIAAMRARLGALVAPRAMIWQAVWPELPSGKTDLAALQRLLA
jgi:long-chain acyl-CoA synthetase